MLLHFHCESPQSVLFSSETLNHRHSSSSEQPKHVHSTPQVSQLWLRGVGAQKQGLPHCACVSGTQMSSVKTTKTTTHKHCPAEETGESFKEDQSALTSCTRGFHHTLRALSTSAELKSPVPALSSSSCESTTTSLTSTARNSTTSRR